MERIYRMEQFSNSVVANTRTPHQTLDLLHCTASRLARKTGNPITAYHHLQFCNDNTELSTETGLPLNGAHPFLPSGQFITNNMEPSSFINSDRLRQILHMSKLVC